MDSRYWVLRRLRLLRFWAQKNWASVIFYSVYVITYVTLSSAATPHVFDHFPDSHTYLTVSFLGHAERLWTIPVVYFFGGTSSGRVALQTITWRQLLGSSRHPVRSSTPDPLDSAHCPGLSPLGFTLPPYHPMESHHP